MGALLRQLGLLLLCGSAPASVLSAQSSSLEQLRLEARAYEHGEGVPKDPQRAARLYCEAASAGDAEAQYNLGWMYANARGVPRDDAQAAYFFRLAAQQGHGHAQQMLRFVGDPGAQVPECVLAQGIDPQAYAAASPAQKRLIDLVRRLAPEYGVNPRLALTVARTESNLNPQAVSEKNAQGLMQLIPETSARFNVQKPFDPEQNVRGGLSYLRWLLAYFRGNVALVAAAYNAGEGAVNRFGGIPPFAETREYVKRIMVGYRQDEHPFDPKIVEPSPVLSSLVVKKTW